MIDKKKLLNYVLELRAGRPSDEEAAEMIYEIVLGVADSLEVRFDDQLVDMVTAYIVDAKRDEIAVKVIGGLLTPEF